MVSFQAAPSSRSSTFFVVSGTRAVFLSFGCWRLRAGIFPTLFQPRERREKKRPPTNGRRADHQLFLSCGGSVSQKIFFCRRCGQRYRAVIFCPGLPIAPNFFPAPKYLRPENFCRRIKKGRATKGRPPPKPRRSLNAETPPNAEGQATPQPATPPTKPTGTEPPAPNSNDENPRHGTATTTPQPAEPPKDTDEKRHATDEPTTPAPNRTSTEDRQAQHTRRTSQPKQRHNTEESANAPDARRQPPQPKPKHTQQTPPKQERQKTTSPDNGQAARGTHNTAPSAQGTTPPAIGGGSLPINYGCRSPPTERLRRRELVSLALAALQWETRAAYPRTAET